MANFTFHFNNHNINVLNSAMIKAVEATGEKMIAEKTMSQEIPLLTGTLQNVQTRLDKSELDKGRLKIVHDTPYALRLYYHPEYNFTKTFNINARGEWWEDYLTGSNKDKPAKYFEYYLHRFSEGVIT